MFMLLPLNGASGLRSQVVEDAVDVGHFVGDAVGDVLEKLEGHILNGGGHGVDGVDGADDDAPLVSALVVAYAYALQIGDSGEILPHFALKTVLAELLAEDGIRLSDGLEPVAGDRAKAADTESRTGNG